MSHTPALHAPDYHFAPGKTHACPVERRENIVNMSTHTSDNEASSFIAGEAIPQNPVKPLQAGVAIGVKVKTIPKTLRLSELAFAALTVLEGKYPKLCRAAIVSMAVLAYAKSAAAAPILKYRMLHYVVLFRLQAAATDIKMGLRSLGQQLFEARKSNRYPAALKVAYETLTAKQMAVLDHAEETLTNMDCECLLADILTGEDHTLLTEMIDELENEKPTTQTEQKKRVLRLKLYKILLR